MTGAGDPVIVPGPYGLWLLGHQTPFGVQTTIDNFRTLADAREFCARHKTRAEVVVGGVRLTDRHCSVVRFVAAARRASAKETAGAIRSSVAAVRLAASALAHAGYLVVREAESRKRGAATLETTEFGASLALSLDASGGAS